MEEEEYEEEEEQVGGSGQLLLRGGGGTTKAKAVVVLVGEVQYRCCFRWLVLAFQQSGRGVAVVAVASKSQTAGGTKIRIVCAFALCFIGQVKG